MSSGQPIIKQLAWLSLPIQVLVLVLLIVAFSLTGIDEAVLLGTFVFLVIFFSLRFLVAREHRRGIALFKKKRYSEAIPHFEGSYKFFTAHKLIDQFRFLTMLSSSRISYREMALLNIAFCYGQAGNRDESRKYYQKTLTEFPDSEIAEASLKLIES